MSVARAAAHGVAWNMAFGVSSRVLTLGSTLVLTRFIAPDEYGAVLTASIAVTTAAVLTSFAFGQYLIARRAPAPVAFQAAVLHIGLGIVAMAVLYGVRHPLGALIESPAMAPFVAWYAMAQIIDRARYVPERLLVRDLRFREIARISGVGEVAFVIVALALASRLGAYAVAYAAVARACVTAVQYFAATNRSEWLVWTPLRAEDVRALFGYGLPIMVAATSDSAATRWDNAVVSTLFGPGVMAQYNFAYSLAEVPISHVAEHIGDVLMPSFARLDDRQRRSGVVRAGGVMALIVWPLAVGLGAVAPTLVDTLFDDRWRGIAPLLTVLRVMTAVRPITWVPVAYLQAIQRTRLIMWLSFARAVMVLPLVALFGHLGGPVWACVGGGIGFTVHSVATAIATGRHSELPVWPYLSASFRPALACLPMAVAVAIVASGLARLGVPGLVSLALQICVGGLAYVGAAFIVARPAALELVQVVTSVIRSRASTVTDRRATAA